MTTSESIAELATALAKAQGELQGATKASTNPFYKSQYADLASVWGACRAALSKHGLAVVQSPSSEGSRVSVETLLMHSSGQWIKDTVSVTAKDDTPQSVGSACTYCRRYALQAFIGIAGEDDDAEAAQARDKKPVVTVPKGYDEWLIDLSSAADNGTPALKAAWHASKEEFRAHLTSTDKPKYDALKAKAAQVVSA